MSSLARCGVWVPAHTVRRCASRSHCANDARHSKGPGAIRGCRTVTSAVTAASANARSGSPFRQCSTATHVARNLVEKGRGFDGRLGVADRLQRIEIHLHPIRRRKRRRLGLGDDGDDRLTHGPKLSPRQDWRVGCIEVSQDGVDAGPKQAVHIAAGVDAGDPRHRSRAVHVQLPDGSPGDGAANKDDREAVAIGQVGDVTTVSGQHSRIFTPGNRRSEVAGGSIGYRLLAERHHRIAACRMHCAA